MSWLDLESLTGAADRPALLDLLELFAKGDAGLRESSYGYQTAAGNPGQLHISAHAVVGPKGLPAYLLAYLRDDTSPPAEQPFGFDTAWARALDL